MTVGARWLGWFAWPGEQLGTRVETARQLGTWVRAGGQLEAAGWQLGA